MIGEHLHGIFLGLVVLIGACLDMPGSLLHLDLSLLFFLFLLLVFLEFDSFEFCVFLGYFVISHFFPHFDVFFIRRCFMT